MSARALIALGGNVGDRQANLDRAVERLAATPGVTVRAVSTYHETSPVGGPVGQGAFLNAAAALDTTLDPEGLLQRLHAIERQAGRVRDERWGERTLDLDVLLMGDLVVDAPALRVPHPRLAVRRFVLAPLAEIAPDAIDPATGRTIRALLRNLDRRPSRVALVGAGSDALRSRLLDALPAVSDPSADGWIVTAFAFDPTGRDGSCTAHDPVRSRGHRPTFVVPTDALTFHRLRRRRDVDRPWPFHRGVPLFWPRPDSPPSVLAGLDPDALPWPPLPTTPEEDRLLVAEIVSACAAARPG